MLKSVNLSVLIQFIMHGVSQPMAMLQGAVYGMMIKPHLKLHRARSSLETRGLPFSSCPPRRAQPTPDPCLGGGKGGGSRAQGERQKGTSAHGDSNRAAFPEPAS